MVYDLLILGSGAAGMMAAVAAGEAARAGGMRLRVGVLEKNSRPGIKVLVCGGGRCNLTNAGSVEFLIAQFGRNGRFLTPALRHMDNGTLRRWFAARGVPTHEEHDGKIYPDSNEARSVVEALVGRMGELGVEVFTGAAAMRLEARAGGNMAEDGSGEGGRFRVTTVDGRVFDARAVVLAVGGQSYTRMGTTGDGYRLAAALGHTLVTPRPAIVGLLCHEEWPKALRGLAVPDVEVRIEVPGPLPRLATGKPGPSAGDMLLTHFGLSGPAVLNISEIVAELLEKFATVELRVDFVRHLSHEQLGGLLRSWQQQHGRKLIKTMLAQNATEVTIQATSPDQSWSAAHAPVAARGAGPAIPGRLAEKLLELAEIPATQSCSQLSSGQIHRLLERLKGSRFTIHATRGFAEAMVTAGGVSLREVNPESMESRVVPGLYLVGEVLDLTGPSGGYNLQLAFSTGHLAGESAARRLGSGEP